MFARCMSMTLATQSSTPEIHQIQKLKFLSPHSNQIKISIWNCTARYRGIWVSRCGEFRRCFAFSVETVMHLEGYLKLYIYTYILFYLYISVSMRDMSEAPSRKAYPCHTHEWVIWVKLQADTHSTVCVDESCEMSLGIRISRLITHVIYAYMWHVVYQYMCAVSRLITHVIYAYISHLTCGISLYVCCITTCVLYQYMCVVHVCYISTCVLRYLSICVVRYTRRSVMWCHVVSYISIYQSISISQSHTSRSLNG